MESETSKKILHSLKESQTNKPRPEKKTVDSDDSKLIVENVRLKKRIKGLEKGLSDELDKSESLERDNLNLRKELSDLQDAAFEHKSCPDTIKTLSDNIDVLRSKIKTLEGQISDYRDQFRIIESNIEETVRKRTDPILEKGRKDALEYLSKLKKEIADKLLTNSVFFKVRCPKSRFGCDLESERVLEESEVIRIIKDVLQIPIEEDLT